MNLQEAIEILTSFSSEPNKEVEPDLIDAAKLGKEALKRWKKHRQQFKAWEYDFLPGETTE